MVHVARVEVLRRDHLGRAVVVEVARHEPLPAVVRFQCHLPPGLDVHRGRGHRSGVPRGKRFGGQQERERCGGRHDGVGERGVCAAGRTGNTTGRSRNRSGRGRRSLPGVARCNPCQPRRAGARDDPSADFLVAAFVRMRVGLGPVAGWCRRGIGARTQPEVSPLPLQDGAARLPLARNHARSSRT